MQSCKGMGSSYTYMNLNDTERKTPDTQACLLTNPFTHTRQTGKVTYKVASQEHGGAAVGHRSVGLTVMSHLLCSVSSVGGIPWLCSLCRSNWHHCSLDVCHVMRSLSWRSKQAA
jgi:hypothetical protein